MEKGGRSRGMVSVGQKDGVVHMWVKGRGNILFFFFI